MFFRQGSKILPHKQLQNSRCMSRLAAQRTSSDAFHAHFSKYKLMKTM